MVNILCIAESKINRIQKQKKYSKMEVNLFLYICQIVEQKGRHMCLLWIVMLHEECKWTRESSSSQLSPAQIKSNDEGSLAVWRGACPDT